MLPHYPLSDPHFLPWPESSIATLLKSVSESHSPSLCRTLKNLHNRKQIEIPWSFMLSSPSQQSCKLCPAGLVTRHLESYLPRRRAALTKPHLHHPRCMSPQERRKLQQNALVSGELQCCPCNTHFYLLQTWKQKVMLIKTILTTILFNCKMS